jgi:hypothetical protein
MKAPVCSKYTKLKYFIVDRRILDKSNLDWSEMYTVLVIAQNKKEARRLAAKNAGAERRAPWLDSKRSDVKMLGPIDSDEVNFPRVIMAECAE